MDTFLKDAIPNSVHLANHLRDIYTDAWVDFLCEKVMDDELENKKDVLLDYVNNKKL